MKFRTAMYLCLTIFALGISAQAASAAPLFRLNPSFITGSSPSSVTTADFNGDGKLDLVTANAGTNNISVRLGDGEGGFAAKTEYPTAQIPTSLTAADFNGDQKPDLAVTTLESKVSVLLGD